MTESFVEALDEEAKHVAEGAQLLDKEDDLGRTRMKNERLVPS